MKPFTIALSPGHTPTQPGVSRGNITEYGLSSTIIGDVIFRLSKLGHNAHMVGDDTNSNQASRINAIAPDFGLELHFNSNTDAAENGTMCLHYPNSKKGKDLATSVMIEISSMLKTNQRKVWPAHYQLDRSNPIIEIIRATNCPFVVVEPLYFSNDSDFQKIDVPAISIAIVEGCLMYWEEVTA